MLFFLTCLYILLYYVRPAEWVPGLIGSPLMFAVGFLSITCTVFAALSGKLNLLGTGSESMTLGFALAIIFSQLTAGYITGAINSFNAVCPAIVGYFLVVTSIDSRQRLNKFILLLILLSTFLAYEGWRQHVTGFSLGGMTPYLEHKVTADGVDGFIPRIRWYGTFNDPNDLGLALVIVLPFLLDMVLRRKILLPLVSLPLITSAIYFTNSRGSMLAAAVSTTAYFIIRYRSIKGVIISAILAVPLLVFGPSRMSQLSASEDSAYGRIEAWYEGYQMFKAHPILGVGQGMFTDYHPITAHNSFVLVMAELGIVGTFFFTGIFYYSFHWVYKNHFQQKEGKLTPADIGLLSSIYASLTGLVAAMFFLSRAYVLVPFIVLGIASASTRLLSGDLGITVQAANSGHHLRNVAILSFMQLIFINLVVKMFI